MYCDIFDRCDKCGDVYFIGNDNKCPRCNKESKKLRLLRIETGLTIHEKGFSYEKMFRVRSKAKRDRRIDEETRVV